MNNEGEGDYEWVRKSMNVWVFKQACEWVSEKTREWISKCVRERGESLIMKRDLEMTNDRKTYINKRDEEARGRFYWC